MGFVAVDECASDPCQNGGQCINGLGQYICACRDEYTGYNCERRESMVEIYLV